MCELNKSCGTRLTDYRARIVKAYGTTVALWLCYVVAVNVISLILSRDPAVVLRVDAPRFLHGFVQDVHEIPPLARWDSIWFYAIARDGYSSRAENSRYSAAFLPLYPFLTRVVSEVGGVDLWTAGLWVSRVCLLWALFLIPTYAGQITGPSACSWGVQFSVLAFPTAFILVSVYAESLFLALTLSTFVFYRQGKYWPSAVSAFLASMTRVHGLALIPALTLMAWTEHVGEERHAKHLAPATAVLAAYFVLGGYCLYAFDDPFRYLTAKQEFWHTKLAMPWTTLGVALEHLKERGLSGGRLGALYVCLEVPSAVLISASVCMLYRRGLWAEVSYLVAGGMLSLVSGSLWGLPRFTLILFPIFAVLAKPISRPITWHIYFLVASMIQVCVLLNYITFGEPPP